MNPTLAWVYLIGLICLYHVIMAIKGSSRRLLSFGYALGGSVLVVVLGMMAIFILTPERATLRDTNSVLDAIGIAVQIAAPIAALIGAHQPPRRVKA